MSKITLPKELFDQLELKDGDEIELIEHSKDSFIARNPNYQADERSLAWFLIPTVISTVIFVIYGFIFKHPHVIPLSGNESIATAVLTFANIVGLGTFITAYVQKRDELYRMMSKRVYWRSFATIIFSMIIINSLVIVALFWFFNQIFHGVNFGLFTSTMIFAIFSAILNYFMIFIVDTFSISRMVNLLILVVIGGLISSMATNGNQYWWQRNFSLLGTNQSQASLQFNLTLVVAAAMMVALFDYLFVAIREKFGLHLRHTILQTLLTLCAASIALVGLIPNNGTGLEHRLHDISAQFIVLFMALAILGIRWFLPKMRRRNFYISYGIVILIVISYLLWHPIHYLTLTAFEILSFSLSLAWVMFLINALTNMLFKNTIRYKVEKEKNE